MVTPSTRSPLARFLCLVSLILLTSSGVAVAQDANRAQAAAARGVPLSQERYSTLNDARTATLNPAGLGLIQRLHAHYAYGASESLGDGHAVHVASPIFGTAGLGLGVEWIRHPDEDEYYRRYRAALGFSVMERLTFGVRYTGFGSEHDAALDDLDSLDLGLQLRLIDQLAVSFLVEHVNTPRFDGSWIEPVMRAGLGWTGWGGRLHVDASYVIPYTEDSGVGLIQGAFSVEPTEGLVVFTQGHYEEDLARFGGGLEARFGPLGVSAAGYGKVEGDSASFDGVTASLKLVAPAAPSLVRTGERWVALSLPAALAERAPRSPFGVAGPSFTDLLVSLDKIIDDGAVDGVVLHIDGSAFGFGQLYELHAVIKRIRKSGKTVVAHLRSASTRSYYLASAAEHIFLAPARNFSVRGLSLTMTFYYQSLMRLGINPEFVKIDRYKSAPEAYTRTGPSPESQEQLEAYLDALYATLIDAVADARGVDRVGARAALDEGPMPAQRALELNLIDGVYHRDALPEAIQQTLGLDVTPVLREGYRPPPEYALGWDVDARIAVVHIDGVIADGPSFEVPLTGTIVTGGDSIEEAMAQAAGRRDIAAIVVRINSPGGSATASETMHRAIHRAAEKKPVIVSMGNIATSGGYYAAVAGDHIFALPTTLTGSIGIFFGKFDISGLFQWLGIQRHNFKRGAFADIFSMDRPWTEEERARTMSLIRSLYDVFIERVAEGRGMTPADVRAVAEGHIWAGDKAQSIGLVDARGGLLEALEEAKKRGGLDPDEPVQLVEMPQRSEWSAFNVTIPLLPSLEAAPLSPSPGPALEVMSDEGAEAILGLLMERVGQLPGALIFEADEPLMMLPFTLGID